MTHSLHDFSVPMLGGAKKCRYCPTLKAERPALAQEHSATSVAAARAIEGGPRAKSKAAVLEAIRAHSGGLTDEAGIEATGLPDSTYRPRRVELVEANLVFDSKKTRLTKSGRSAVIWMAR